MSRSGGSGSGHELVDHTSEVTVRLRAPTFSDLIVEATKAFGDMVPASTKGVVVDEWREFEMSARDRPASLVEWLNEMVYLCEVDQWLASEVEVTAEDESRLRLRARGVTLQEPFVLVKAATLHNATVREGPDGFEGEVTLDI